MVKKTGPLELFDDWDYEDRLSQIKQDIMRQKLNEYSKIGQVRSIVNGDAGNLNGLETKHIARWMDENGYNYEIRPSETGEGDTIWYIPKKNKTRR